MVFTDTYEPSAYGHIWVDFFHFADPLDARKLNDWIPGACEVCQVANPPRGPYKCPLESTPIPPYLMDSVAVDLFAQPEVTFGGQKFDIMALCVDRESGSIVATPT